MDNKKNAGTRFFIGSAQFFILLIIAEAVYPNYSVSANYISDLGVWGKTSAIIFNPSIIFMSLLNLTGTYYVQKEFKTCTFSSFLALTGLGSLLVGFFPEDTILVNGVPLVHSIGALMAFIFGGIAAITAYRITKSPFRHFSVVLGAASLLALMLFFTTASAGYLGLGVGGMERMITYPAQIWTLSFGAYLMAPQN